MRLPRKIDVPQRHQNEYKFCGDCKFKDVQLKIIEQILDEQEKTIEKLLAENEDLRKVLNETKK